MTSRGRSQYGQRRLQKCKEPKPQLLLMQFLYKQHQLYFWKDIIRQAFSLQPLAKSQHLHLNSSFATKQRHSCTEIKIPLRQRERGGKS